MRIRRYADTPILRDVFDGIRAEPARVALSFMAVAIGVVAFVLLLAVLGGLREKSRLLVRELGANVFAIVSGSGGESGQTQELQEKIEIFLKDSPNKVRLLDRFDKTIQTAVRLGFLKEMGLANPESADARYEVRRIVKAKITHEKLAEIRQKLVAYAEAAQSERFN